MHLYLIRHGQSEENAHGWDGSNTNSPLTELGQTQAKALAVWFSENLTVDKIYCSPMQRARQTAQPLCTALNLKPIHDDRLREVGNAYPDSSPFPEDGLPRFILGVWGSRSPYDSISENGENWMQFRARVGGFLERLVREAPAEHEKLNIAVVCHGGVIEGFFEHIFQKGPWSAVVVTTSNTGITHLEYHPREGMPDWWLHYHNWTRHLSLDQLS